MANEVELLSESDITEVINEVIERFLIPKYIDLGLKSSGNWENSLEVKASLNNAVITGPKYTEQMVYGRRPGKLPPIEPIRQWLAHKGLIANPYAVAKNIAKRGTAAYRRGGTSLLEVLETDECISFIRSRLISRLTVNVNNKIKRDLRLIWK